MSPLAHYKKTKLGFSAAAFKFGFGVAVLAWIMQLGVFWLPVLTGNVDYGHGVCIKLAGLDATNHNHSNQSHSNHAHHQHAHDSHAHHHSARIQADPFSVSKILAPDSSHLYGNHLSKSSDKHPDGDHSAGSHCDICALFAAMGTVGGGLHITPLAVFVERAVPYQPSLHELAFFYNHPPPRAPPALF